VNPLHKIKSADKFKPIIVLLRHAKTILYISAMFFFIAAAAGSLLFLNNFFRIKKLVIITPKKEVRGLSDLSEENFISLNEEILKQKLLKVNPLIREISVDKNFPDSLTIITEWRKPAARIFYKDKMLMLDAEGKPAESETGVDLPEITGRSLLLRPDEGDWRIVKAINYITSLAKSEIRVKNISISDDDSLFILQLEDGENVKIPFQGELQVVAASLQVIISRFRIEGKFISAVDFRYDKPLVILKNE